MTDKELLLQAVGVPTVYLDGFGAFRKINGVLRCVGFSFGSGAQLNMVVSLVGADQAYRDTQRVLEEPPVKGPAVWKRPALAH